ncbi:MAG: polysaccharide biosynthesis tyrosine autokinase [Elainella sp. Prado103]|nr:polysaccharide biosynthesis tyrosine autokinase [Elainella sp. Prado103]
MVLQNSQKLAATPTSGSPVEEGGLEIGKVLDTLRRRLPIIAGVTAVFAGIALLKILTEKPVYRAGFEILTGSVTVEAEVLSSLPETLSSSQEQSLTLDKTKIRVLLSPSVLTPVLENLQETYPNITYDRLVSGLRIQIDSENILQVSYRHPDPAFVETVLDLLSNTYLTYSLEDRQKDIRQGLTFVEDQLPKLQSQVTNLQEKLQQFRQRYNLIDPQLQAEQVSAQRGSVLTDLVTTQTQLRETQLLYQELQAALAQQAFEMAGNSPLIQSTRYQKLLDQLLEVDSKLAEEATLYYEGTPEIDTLQEQRRNLMPLLQREGLRVEQQVRSQIQELGNRQQALTTSLTNLNQEMKQLSFVTREYNEIQQQLQIATDNLSQFLAKREGLRIDAAQRQVPWRLLTAPSNPIPTSTSMAQTLGLGTVLGLLLGTGVALALDRLSSLVHSPKEVKDITKLPLLGVIPNYKELQQSEIAWHLMLPQGDTTAITDASLYQVIPPEFLEAFRSLCVNIRLMSPDASLQSIAVSSAIPDSGKTTIALYLAQVAAAMGQKVLLIDTDLRRPSLHHRLQLSGNYGLTDILSNLSEFDQAIQKVTWEPNLFFMAAGTVPPDPTRILASAAMKQLVTKSQHGFDLVIYDTAPILGFADTYLLSAQVDGLLLVTRLKQIKRAMLEQVVEDLTLASAPLLGVVVNDSQEKLPITYSYYQVREEES